MSDRTPPPAPERAAATLSVDAAVVGAGAAGLYTALCAARAGARVALVSRSPLDASASYWAQGGVAAALADDDSPSLHARDTLTAGRRASRASAVEVLCAESPDCVRDLAELGVRFDADGDGGLALGLEGGHSQRRVAHAGGSATGRRITHRLSELVSADDRIEVLEQTTAERLLVEAGRCVGLLAAPTRARGPAIEVRARGTVLATGGAAALWARTTNPPGAIGAGLALAWEAGAALADLELVQFHPTALRSADEHDGFLLTEALRGEGALLLDHSGERFVDELAPRDEVALAIAGELGARPGGRVVLDLRALDGARFPNVFAALARAGLDPAREPIPVAPAAHYTMGGIAVDLGGRSTLPGLLAVGECSCTGLHGANRLASNSLAECLVFGRRAAAAALDDVAVAAPPVGVPDGPPARAPAAAQPAWSNARTDPKPPEALAAAATGDPVVLPPSPATRRALWAHAGLERSAQGLATLADDPHPLARAIARSAMARSESRGAHRRSDRPSTDSALDDVHLVAHGEGPPTAETWS